MRTGCAVLLVLVVACGDEVDPKPDPTSSETTSGVGGSSPTSSSSSSSSASSTSSTGSGGDGGGGGQEGPPAGFEEGARLKVRAINGTDGSKQLAGFYDSQLQTNCFYVTASDGSTRCMPLTASGQMLFTNATCSQAVLVGDCFATQPYYALPVSIGSGCTAAQGFRVFEAGTPSAATTFYYGTPANCQLYPSPISGQVYNATELPPSSFVQGTESVQ